MLRLTLGNSYSKLEGLTVKHYRSLRKVLSYKVQGSYFSGDHTGGVRYLLSKDGSFPSGLLKQVFEWLETYRVPYQIKDLRKPVKGSPGTHKLKLGTIKPYKEQLNAVQACRNAKRGTVTMPTGSGKSVTMALLVHALQLKTLVVVPNLGLKQQLTESFSLWFGKKNNITIHNIDSPELAKPGNYDCLIIDEAHHVAAAAFRRLNKRMWGGIYHRYFFTATPFRGQEEETILMQGISGELIYKLTYTQALAAKMVCPIEAYYYELPKQEVKGYTWAEVYKELVVHNQYRNEIINALMQSLTYAGRSALLLVKEVAHGHAFPRYPFAHGDNPDTLNLIKAFSKASSRLVATTGVCGEGVDTKLCEFMILGGLGRSKPALMQSFGRAMRIAPDKESGKIILFRDKSHKWTKAHFKEQCKVLIDEFGVIPIKLKLDG